MAEISQPEAPRSDWPVMGFGHRMPDVALIGAAKSATTTLANRLAEHPKIFMCARKEPDFFSFDSSFVKGLDWYTSLYQGIGPDQLALDASTTYTRWPQYPLSPVRMFHYAPEVKLIYLMRHPVDRAFSHYVHRWTKETHRGEPFRIPFEQYVQQDPMCLDSSNYEAQIKEYLGFYPESSLLCLFTFQFKKAALDVLRRICRFLDLDDAPHHFQQESLKANRSSEFLESRVRIRLTNRIKAIPGWVRPFIGYPSRREFAYGVARKSNWGRKERAEFTPEPMKPATRHELIKRFASSNAWVAEFTGQDLSCWNT